jgi:biopolymer transport protein ExbB/TolQ
MKRTLLLAGTLLGALLAFAPIAGLLGMITGFIGSFNDIAGSVTASPSHLAGGIRGSMTLFIAACVAGLVGVVMLVACSLALARSGARRSAYRELERTERESS